MGGEILACPICLDEHEAGSEIKDLGPFGCTCRSGRMYYHAECIDRWLQTRNQCPTCRADIRVPAEPQQVAQPEAVNAQDEWKCFGSDLQDCDTTNQGGTQCINCDLP